MAHLEASIVTPSKKVFEGQISYLSAPGRVGEFGVLPGHENFITILDPGVIKLEIEADRIEEIFVTGGYFEVSEDRVVVIADEAYRRDEIDRDEVINKAKELKEKLDAEGFGSPDYEKLKLQYDKYSRMAEFVS